MIYAAGLWALLHTFMLVFEEPQLKRRYKTAYEQYLAEVPRWIPRLNIRGISAGYRAAKRMICSRQAEHIRPEMPLPPAS
jgi:hypothetical protein